MKLHHRLLYCGAMIAGLTISVGALADSREDACLAATQQAISDPAVACEIACTQAMRLDKYDYHASLAAAMKSRAGLDAYIQYTQHSSLTGQAADEQACHVVALLLKWGDAPFSQTVAHAGAKAKAKVSSVLEYASVSDFKTRFPQTYALASQRH